MAGRLGCLDNIQVFVTDQCTSPRLCELTNIIEVTFNRRLDEVSEAVVAMAISDPECCVCLKDIEPWCHMVHIVRNGEIVWQGPVVRITYGFEGVQIEARDILAFLEITVPKAVLNTTALFPNGTEITDLGELVLQTAFVDRNPCFIANIIKTDVDDRPTMFSQTAIEPEDGFEAYTGTMLDWFTVLAENGMDYTAIGMNIILSVENAQHNPIGTLRDEHIMGEVQLVKDGFLQANRVFVRYEGDTEASVCAANCAAGANRPTPCESCTATGDVQPCFSTPCPAIAEGEFYCYGPVERLFDNGAVGNFTTAQQTAQIYVDFASIAPRTLNLESGSRLSQDTPWEFNDMIPGSLVKVALNNLCFDTFESYILQEVNYTLSADGDEEITVSMGAINSITGSQ